MIGIIILYSYSLVIEPKEVELKDIGEYEGQLVIVRGIVLDVVEFTNSRIIVLGSEGSMITIFLATSSVELFVGDEIEVTGLVQKDTDGYSLSVTGKGSIRVLSVWEDDNLTLPALATDPWKRSGLNVNISCIIKYPLEIHENYSYFSVQDVKMESYSIQVFVFEMTVPRGYAGHEITLHARFEFSKNSFSHRLVIDSPEHAVILI